MKATSLDLREKILKAYDTDPLQNQETLANRFLVSQSTVSRLLSRLKNNKPLSASSPPGLSLKLSSEDLDFLKEELSKKNDLTYNELSERLYENRAKKVSPSTVFRAIKIIGMTRKKRLSMTQKKIQIKQKKEEKSL